MIDFVGFHPRDTGDVRRAAIKAASGRAGTLRFDFEVQLSHCDTVIEVIIEHGDGEGRLRNMVSWPPGFLDAPRAQDFYSAFPSHDAFIAWLGAHAGLVLSRWLVERVGRLFRA